MLYRRTVRDGLEVAKDRGETDFVQKLLELNKSLTEQNASLRSDFERLATERANTLSKVGKLESDVEHANGALKDAHDEIALLRRQLGLRITGDET
jgi:chromosome segregation ATPase